MAKISIHAPARGGDRKYFHSLFTCFYFNPRPREGGRRCGIAGAVQGIAISIHAPARGGDSDGGQQTGGHLDFNPRPREGGRRGVPAEN